jgi:hypothetical protein
MNIEVASDLLIYLHFHKDAQNVKFPSVTIEISSCNHGLEAKEERLPAVVEK